LCLDGIKISGYYHDMRKKISTVLDETLFRRTRLESARRGKQISEIVSEALEEYLGKSHQTPGPGFVAESYGIFKISGRKLQRVMEEDGLLDS
jgi:hypothetical protein